VFLGHNRQGLSETITHIEGDVEGFVRNHHSHRRGRGNPNSKFSFSFFLVFFPSSLFSRCDLRAFSHLKMVDLSALAQSVLTVF
jgi:hypothetical protein